MPAIFRYLQHIRLRMNLLPNFALLVPPTTHHFRRRWCLLQLARGLPSNEGGHGGQAGLVAAPDVVCAS